MRHYRSKREAPVSRGRIGPRPGPRRLVGQVVALHLDGEDLEAACLVVGQCGGVVEAAGVHPDPPDVRDRPCPLERDGEEVASGAPADELGHEAEVRDLDLGAVLALELEVPGGASSAAGHPRLDFGPVEPHRPPLVGPRQAPQPVPVTADRRVEEPVQLGLGLDRLLDRDRDLRRAGWAKQRGVAHLQRPRGDVDTAHRGQARRSSAERWWVIG